MVPAMLSPASPLAAPFISLLARASKDMPPSHAPVARNTLERRIAATGLRRGSSDWAAAQDTRSQHRNRELALERLASRLGHALTVRRPRTKTRPTRASQQRRVDAKKRRGQTKQARRRPDAD